MSKKKIILLVVLLLSVICLFAGISVSIFTFFGKGNTNNVIETGKIIFSYSDADEKGNGINMENSFPMHDSDGILLSSENEYFDFSVLAYTTKKDLNYEIVVVKDENSTFDDKDIKIYLTEFDGNTEKPVPIEEEKVLTYDELTPTTNTLLKGKTVYYGTVQAGEVSYGKKFRLRMWIKYPDNEDINYEDINEKMFKVKVNVAAVASN